MTLWKIDRMMVIGFNDVSGSLCARLMASRRVGTIIASRYRGTVSRNTRKAGRETFVIVDSEPPLFPNIQGSLKVGFPAPIERIDRLPARDWRAKAHPVEMIPDEKSSDRSILAK